MVEKWRVGRRGGMEEERYRKKTHKRQNRKDGLSDRSSISILI